MRDGLVAGLHPLAARRAEIAKTVLPPSASIPDEPTEMEQQRRVLLQNRVFGHEGIMRTIVAFL